MLITQTYVCIMLTIIAVVQAGPALVTTESMIYSSKLGYVPPSYRNSTNSFILNADSQIKALEDFQSFAGLNATGKLETVAMKRCGVPDKDSFGKHNRSKRYVLFGSRWNRKALTYKISKYPSQLKKTKVNAEFARAFDLWSNHTGISFKQKCLGTVDIEIKFEKGEHGDEDAFDGANGTILAHAFFPKEGGDIHFDDEELWTIGSYHGINLFQTAVHEIGHSLGLEHSEIPSSVMSAKFTGFKPDFKLDCDDIAAAHALYGDISLRNNTANNYLLCKDPKIDTIFNSVEGETYVFKGKKYYKLVNNTVAQGYPKLISKGWPGLKGNINAAFTYRNRRTYFFKGRRYWCYHGHKLDYGYPKQIKEEFEGVPSFLNATMVWGSYGKIYFFKGSEFYRYDPLKNPPIKSKFPISNLKGLPDNLDAALYHTNGYMYFFKGAEYYRFDDLTLSVASDNPPYPRPTANWWFGCKN